MKKLIILLLLFSSCSDKLFFKSGECYYSQAPFKIDEVKEYGAMGHFITTPKIKSYISFNALRKADRTDCNEY